MALKVGISGGIGSGKTYICGVLEKMGYPVYYSDSESKRLTNTHPDIVKGLQSLLGQEVYIAGELNKVFMAEKIFSDDNLRIQVNQLIHPIVRNDFTRWVSEQTSPVVFNEAAILFETGAYKTMDFMVLVTAEKEIRIQRTMERDKVSRQEVLNRMSKQWDDEQKIPLADFVVYNDNRPLLDQLEELEKELLSRHATKS